MTDWKLEIRKVEDGYILEGEFDCSSEKVTESVVKIDDTEFGEIEAMEILLWKIMNYFAIHYSKHNKKNLIVKIEEINKEI